MNAVARRQAAEARSKAQDRRHQLIACEPSGPLGHIFEVARVEGQRSAAVGLPDAMAVPEACERPLVPVLDDVEPCVAESLAIFGRQSRIEPNHVLRVCWLAIVARVLER